jgi:hypothetical protein
MKMNLPKMILCSQQHDIYVHEPKYEHAAIGVHM